MKAAVAALWEGAIAVATADENFFPLKSLTGFPAQNPVLKSRFRFYYVFIAGRLLSQLLIISAIR